MSRRSKLTLFLALLVFTLACSLVTKPVQDVQNLASTAESLATAMPIETLKALPSAMPELATSIPGIGGVADPKDPPLTEWNGIPIMPAATAGAESSEMYSFKADATVQEAMDYYKTELTNLGYKEFFTMPDTGSGALLTYEKENHTVTVTITITGVGGILVFLTYQ